MKAGIRTQCANSIYDEGQFCKHNMFPNKNVCLREIIFVNRTNRAYNSLRSDSYVAFKSHEFKLSEIVIVVPLLAVIMRNI